MPDHSPPSSRAAILPTEVPYTTRPLDASTWDAFAELVERNNGIYGGCWCSAYHTAYQRGVSDPRALKEQLVRAGCTLAVLVLDDNRITQGWCQDGSPEELGLKHNREYAKAPPPPARWRIACIFVDKRHRGQGIARAALKGALAQIAAAGGGLVETTSEVTTGREAGRSASTRGSSADRSTRAAITYRQLRYSGAADGPSPSSSAASTVRELMLRSEDADD
jgi:GNAT superfamily N-acetyltransferase